MAGVSVKREAALEAARRSVKLCNEWHEGRGGTGHSNFCLVSRQLLIETGELGAAAPADESPLSMPEECLA